MTHYVITVEDLLNPYTGKPGGKNYDPRIVASGFVDESTVRKAIAAAKKLLFVKEYLGRKDYAIYMRANTIDLNEEV